MLEIPRFPIKGDASQESQHLRLNAADVYKELTLRGYDYGGPFQGIMDANNIGMNALILFVLSE